MQLDLASLDLAGFMRAALAEDEARAIMARYDPQRLAYIDGGRQPE